MGWWDALSGGGDSRTRNSQQSWPYEQASQYIWNSIGGAEQAQNNYTPYTGSFYAPMNSQQQQGLQMLQQSAEQMQSGVVDPALAAWQNMLSGPDNVQDDPGLQAMQDAFAQRTGNQFNDQILPGISSNAAAAGHRGSTRMDLAQGLAADRAQQAIAGNNASLLNNAYNQAMGQQTAAMQNSGTMGQLSAMPGQTLYNAGALQQADQQGQLDNSYRQYQQQVLGPINMYNQAAGTASTFGGLGGFTQGSANGDTSGSVGGALGNVGRIVGGLGGIVGGLF